MHNKAARTDQVAVEGPEVVAAVTRCLKRHNAGNATHPLALNRTVNRTTHDSAQAVLLGILNGTANASSYKYKEHRPEKGRGATKAKNADKLAKEAKDTARDEKRATIQVSVTDGKGGRGWSCRHATFR